MYAFTKRIIDVVLAAGALVVLAPFLFVVGVIVRIESPGPAFFRQRRLGFGGVPFMMLKFRSMYVDADESLHRAAIARAARGERVPGANGKGSFKPIDDPRVTRVGRVLRATCVDELPQLINVLRGEMSLVGPRPALEYELEHYEPEHRRRFAVRPGLTGLWQVHRAEAEDLHEMLQMDIAYVEAPSMWIDVKLIAMTIPAIVRERGEF
jgi:lipopolysaccharide/colanic/teichoic acid biosynthesis glycosyltransferase